MSAPNSAAHSNDIEITLTAGDIRLTVSPVGASLRGLSRVGGDESYEIVTEYRGAGNKVAGQGDVLIPFPGRVEGGAYTFEGASRQMHQNDRETPSAIHGFVREVVWDIVEQSPRDAVFHTRIDADQYAGYPYSLDMLVTYRATEDGMVCDFTVQNVGDQAAPVAVGFHPYFTTGSQHIDDDDLQVAMESYVELKDLLPTGRVLPVEGTIFDFRATRNIGATTLNTCFAVPRRDSDGLVRVVLTNKKAGRRVTVWMDEAYKYVVLYSGDPLPDSHRRRSLAIEPMTCGVDAFNHPEWGLIGLPPGESTSGRWGVIAG